MEIKEIMELYKKKFLTLDQVIGIGRGYKEVSGECTDNESIHVLVKKKLPKKELRRKDVVPTELDGVPTDVIEIGELKALGTRTERIRPAQPGTSIAHYLVTAGTFGAIVYDKISGQPLILSNNHILANGSTAAKKRAKIGDPILQPGSYDGGTVADDIIARLVRYIPLQMKASENFKQSQAGLAHFLKMLLGSLFGQNVDKGAYFTGENIVDCALALPTNLEMVTEMILEIGPVAGVREPKLQEILVKSGRTSGVTSGRVRTLDATVTVEMGQGEQATFKDQITIGLHSEGGDSGSLVLDQKNNACGLLFAGSDTVTICNPIAAVLRALNVTFEHP